MRRFYFPDLGISVEADSREEAQKQIQPAEKPRKRSPSKA